jgi:hypothetical protein
MWVIACSLPPLIDMHVSYYDDGLRWLINDDGYIIVLMLIYFTVMIVIWMMMAIMATFVG